MNRCCLTDKYIPHYFCHSQLTNDIAVRKLQEADAECKCMQTTLCFTLAALLLVLFSAQSDLIYWIVNTDHYFISHNCKTTHLSNLTSFNVRTISCAVSGSVISLLSVLVPGAALD